jgi:hypothetical protein
MSFRIKLLMMLFAGILGGVINFFLSIIKYAAINKVHDDF